MTRYKITGTIFLLYGLLGCQSKKDEAPAGRFQLTDTMRQRISIDTATLQLVQSELRFSGKVTPADNKITSVFPVVSGFITRLNV
ncbi:MAG: hypothetical protein JNL59_04065, partial [Chitinophagaceae bacterium]|nr:hypothetical protein [Chitinophagaceae bacterium]